MKLNELSNYIAGVFNIDINDIIYLNSEKEMISPSIKIVNMMILYPQKFKSIIIANKKEKANQSQDYNSTSMNNLNQVSQIKSDVESQSKNIYAYDDKKRFTKPPQDMISSSISNLTPHNNPSSNYMNYRPPNKINKNQTELYSTMQSGDFEPNTLNEPYSPNLPPHVSNYNTSRLPKTQTPNRNRNPYSMNNNNINNIPKQIPSTKPTAMFVPNESTMNKDTAQMPIEVRYKSEKRIYRDKNRKGKEIDVGNDYYNNNSNNNLIISTDGSIGDEEMKFKPSYPVNKYSYKSSSLIGKGRGYEGEKKESLNKSSRQFFQGNRVFNEDFLDNE